MTKTNMNNILNDKYYLLMRLLIQTYNAMMKARNRELAQYDFTRRQAAILQITKAAGGDVSAYKIARWLILEPHSLVKVLNRMEKDGLVKRSIKKGVRKESKISLTEKGIEAYEKVCLLISINAILSVLSERQFDELWTISKLMRDKAMQQIGIKAPLPFPPF